MFLFCEARAVVALQATTMMLRPTSASQPFLTSLPALMRTSTGAGSGLPLLVRANFAGLTITMRWLPGTKLHANVLHLALAAACMHG